MWAIGPPKLVSPSLMKTRSTSNGEPRGSPLPSAARAPIVLNTLLRTANRLLVHHEPVEVRAHGDGLRQRRADLLRVGQQRHAEARAAGDVHEAILRKRHRIDDVAA